MILGGRSLTNLSIDDFQSLIENRVPENPHLDYKKTAYSGRADDIREMLRDICALANAEGGYLVMGITEDDFGRAAEFAPIDNPYPIEQAIRQSCLDGISERIPNFDIRVFDLSETTGIIVVHIPQSEKSPHMVSREHRTDFYRRYGTDKRSMTVDEIRDAFLTNPIYRRLVEWELIAQGQLSAEGNGISKTVPPYFQILTERSVERFMQRYLLSSVQAQVLLLMSPFIGDLAKEPYSLEDLLEKAQEDNTRVYIITQAPREDYHRAGLAILESRPFVEIRYNPDVHAKLYICWSKKEEESYALFGSGNLTPSGLRHNIELGMMISSQGHGRTLVRDLYQWGSYTIRSTSKRVKAITSQKGE